MAKRGSTARLLTGPSPHGIEHGGWCPAGRRAERPGNPRHVSLQQTPERNYHQRTRWNVRDSDATLIITWRKELTGGSLFTRDCARNLDRPCLHIYPSSEWRERIRIFLKTNPVRILNVAGPRNSSAKNLQPFVQEALDEALKTC